MQCPSCHHEYRLTWPEYFREMRGHHTCPKCGSRFRLRYSFSYVCLAILGCAIGGVPLALLAFYCLGWFAIAPGWFVGALVTGIPVDRILDDRYRAAVAIKKPDLASR